MHLAAPSDQELVNVGGRAADMGIRRAVVAFLVAAQTAASAAFASGLPVAKAMFSSAPMVR